MDVHSLPSRQCRHGPADGAPRALRGARIGVAPGLSHVENGAQVDLP
jgi:hypothetical protein